MSRDGGSEPVITIRTKNRRRSLDLQNVQFVLDPIFPESQLNVHAGEHAARPPDAPTTDRVERHSAVGKPAAAERRWGPSVQCRSKKCCASSGRSARRTLTQVVRAQVQWAGAAASAEAST